MSFVKILMSVPDSCETMKNILQLKASPVNQVDNQNLQKLIGDMVDGSQLSYTKISTCLVQATGNITFNGLLANDTITVNGTATPVGPGAGPNLGAAATMASAASTTVTNTGSSVLTGDLALSPAGSITGFPPGTVSGTIYNGGATASAAQTAMTAAYNDLASRPTNVDLTGQNLGGLTLVPGVYNFSTSAQLTGTLTLDAQNNPNAVFVFKIGSTLTTASASTVTLINQANASNVFWQVGSSATIGTTTAMKGTIIALASVTMNTGAALIGRALARTAAVTLDTNVITVPTAPVPAPGSGTTFTAKVTPTGLYEFALGANDTAAAFNAAVKINAIMSNLVSASAVGNVITITAVQPGVTGSAIVISSSNNTRATVVTMSGGSDGVEATINYGWAQ